MRMRENYFRLRHRQNVVLAFGKLNLRTKFDKNRTRNGSAIVNTSLNLS